MCLRQRSRDKVMEKRLLMSLEAPCSSSDWHFVTRLPLLSRRHPPLSAQHSTIIVSQILSFGFSFCCHHKSYVFSLSLFFFKPYFFARSFCLQSVSAVGSENIQFFQRRQGKQAEWMKLVRHFKRR